MISFGFGKENAEMIIGDLIGPYSRFPDKRCRHYGVYCEDHIIDVIAAEEPVVRKLPVQ